MRTAVELNAFLNNKHTYCISAKSYAQLINDVVGILNPTEDVCFIAGTDTIQDVNGPVAGLGLVVLTADRIIYGIGGSYMQLPAASFASASGQIANNEGWITIMMKDNSYVMFKILSAQVNNGAVLINECYDPAAQAAKAQRENEAREAAAAAEEKRRENTREHYEYDIQTIVTPQYSAIDRARLSNIIADYAGRGYRLHTITTNEVKGVDGNISREDVLLFERKYR